MSMRRLLLSAALSGLAMAATPTRASADWLFTPFVGVNFGGSANFGQFDDFDDEFERRSDFGASLTWMGKGAVGFEADFGWAPNFFQDTRGTGNFEFGDNNVTTLMGNLVLGAPIGGQSGPGLRPYGSAGVGLIRSRIDGGGLFNNVNANDFGFNVGAGVHGFFNDNVGLRGDVRYFRSLQDNNPSSDDLDLGLSNFHFWRATVGLTFRFGGN
jgi:opacity protein-like surface antigen